MKKRAGRPPLLVRVWAELGAAKITEAFIHDGKDFTDGICVGGRITINPVHQTVDTIVHELLHRMNPEWSEVYVRRTTSYLRRRMTDEETVAFYGEYLKRARKRKTRVELT